MNLHEYISSGEMTQSELAKKLGISPVLVHQWAKGDRGEPGGRQVPAERCPEIEKATGGAVRCEDLRPDVDWAYLRGSTADPNPSPIPSLASQPEPKPKDRGAPCLPSLR